LPDTPLTAPIQFRGNGGGGARSISAYTANAAVAQSSDHKYGVHLLLDRYNRITTNSTTPGLEDVRPGDTLIAIDDESIQGDTLEKIRNKMRGERGSVVKLTISSGSGGTGTRTKDYSVLRNHPLRI
jgi:hypothetical protein